MSDKNCFKAALLAGLNEENLNQLTNVAKFAAKEGGNILMQYYGKIKNIKNKSRSGDLVTEADLACEEFVVNYLNSKTPKITIHAEERGLNGLSDELCWYVDPLDGTTNYAHGYPFFATSIGLAWRDMPVLGAISIPFLNELYWGAPKLGVYCNNNRIKVSSSNVLINSLLVTGFAYDRCEVKDNNYAEFCYLTHRTRGVRRGGAAAVDLAFVASGRLDGYWERGLAKWDLAAGAALIELAGGLISDYPKGDFNLRKGRILACTPAIQKELQTELNKVIPLEEGSYGASKLRCTEP
ncbi:inositol monophosphatase family protein [Prochlorococcus sp. MIT 1307]|uniref:inositol monophosphatase family protein n=1 Tax=Prochlorococcus sp. MIT 1307 TaxID=3096219 RepID=UPI002A7543AA|nr:inositol monophosphatase family protein [Prochlorococcus sp. MIT 1307]